MGRPDESRRHCGGVFPADVTDFDSVGEMIRTIETEIGPIDTLVNNAGITRDGRLLKMSKDDWHAVINSNLNSVFNCTRHVLQGMVDRKFGRIINISSVNGQRGQFGQTNYSAAKAGMHGFYQDAGNGSGPVWRHGQYNFTRIHRYGYGDGCA
jgi:acetoacetyl-CoA reductase